MKLQTMPETPPRSLVRDDMAYILPMGIFLVLTQIGVWWPSIYATTYMVKSFATAIALYLCWKAYTRIEWTHWKLGVLVGVLGLVQWVGMEKLLVWYGPSWTRMSVDWGHLFNPYKHFEGYGETVLWSFIAIRWACATLVVPFMEELFWRDFLWRSIMAPNDFKLASIGEWDWRALIIVSAAFSSVHIQWLTAFVWGLMIGVLLIRTRSIGACVIAHGVTNLLLGAYVLITHDWYFW